MVFPSIRVYLDPPNWQQEPNQHQANGSTDESAHQLLPPLPPQAQGPQVGSIRPGSMADRAQIAKIPTPPPPPTEAAALKCPRCESTNTKFCYFNNYSLSQPRHFCKTCRRYWTRGGALRNVPVGGGCRRNKKSKRGRSKSPAAPATEKHSPLPNSASAVAVVPSGATCHELIGQFPQPSNRGFMASLQNISRYGTVGNMGQTEHMGFPIGGGVEQWRLQQFPSFLSGFESAVSSASYPFQSDQSVEAVSAGLIGFGDMGASSRVTQMPPVKLEGSGGLNLIRSPLSVSHENNQYYSWTDLSGLASSSTSHLL